MPAIPNTSKNTRKVQGVSPGITGLDLLATDNPGAATALLSSAFGNLAFMDLVDLSLSNYTLKSNNLSDLANAGTARTNLGLGGLAVLNLADLSLSSYPLKANNLSDLANAGTARTNLGLGSLALQASSSVSISGGTVGGIALTCTNAALTTPAIGAATGASVVASAGFWASAGGFIVGAGTSNDNGMVTGGGGVVQLRAGAQHNMQFFSNRAVCYRTLALESAVQLGWGIAGDGNSLDTILSRVAVGTVGFNGGIRLAASTTARPHLNLAVGVAPTSPADGDIWYESGAIKIRIGGTTRTFTVT